METGPSPEGRPRRVTVDVAVQTRHSIEIMSFSNYDTVVRTFSDKWSHMNYVWTMHPDTERARVLFNVETLGEYLIDIGCQEQHVDEPNDFDRRVYLEHARQRLDEL